MRSFVAARSNQTIILLAGILIGIASLWSASQVSANTDVYATICVESSSLTIASPVSDSTVTEGSVTLSGTVAQSNQIEVFIDDAFDSTIPLTIGQTEYSSSVQIPTGTHTIRAEAINSCGGTNATASSVVTFTPPPSEPSVGSETPTNVEPADTSVQSRGVTGPGVGTSALASLPLPQSIRTPLENGLFWLGVDMREGTGTGAGRLTPIRAVVVIASMSLLALVFIPRTRHALAASRFATRLMPERTLIDRKRVITWTLLGGGGFILFIALFW